MATKNIKIASGVASETINDNFLPFVGMIIPFLGPITQTSSSNIITTTAPAGWLLCNGDSFTQTNYPLLYTFLGGAGGVASLPNYAGLHLSGYAGTVNTNTFGFANHSHAITAGTTAAVNNNNTDTTHSHAGKTGTGSDPWTSPNHSHGTYVTNNAVGNNGSGAVGRNNGATYNVHPVTHAHYGTNQYAAGSSTANGATTHSHGTYVNATNNSTFPVHSHTMANSTGYTFSEGTAGNPTSANTLKNFQVNFIIKAG